MHEARRLLLFIALAPVLVLAQTREPGATQVIEPRQAGGTTAPESSYGRDSFSTTMTGARIALGPGDLLELTVFDTPELTQKVRVNGDGKIVLSLIGEVEVKGMAPDVLESLIRRRLIEGHFLKNPQVSVFVAEYGAQVAYVTGEVNRPGAYPLLRSHSLQDLIAVAGGLSARAGNNATITRGGGAAQSIRVDLSGKDESLTNPEINPGDRITVSQTGVIYVLGDVARPGGFLLDRRSTLSVVQAVALAEGTTPSAALSKARLIRVNQGERQEIPLNLRLILKSQGPDLLLQAGDILFVPGSLTRGLGRRSIETILATASGVAIYAYRP